MRCSQRSTRSPRRCTSGPRSRRPHPPAQRTALMAPARRPTARVLRTSSTPRSWTRASKAMVPNPKHAPEFPPGDPEAPVSAPQAPGAGAPHGAPANPDNPVVPEPTPAPEDTQPGAEPLRAGPEQTPEDAIEQDLDEITARAKKADE